MREMVKALTFTTIFQAIIKMYTKYPSIHPSSYSGSQGSARASPSSPWMKGRGSPWTGHQSSAGLHVDKQPCTLTITLTGNLEPPTHLTCIYLDCVRKPEYPEKTHAGVGRICKLHTERPLLRFESGTFFLWGNSANRQVTTLPKTNILYQLSSILSWDNFLLDPINNSETLKPQYNLLLVSQLNKGVL